MPENVDRVFRKCSINWITDLFFIRHEQDYFEGNLTVVQPYSVYTICHPYYGRITDTVYNELHHIDSDEVRLYDTAGNCIKLQEMHLKRLIEREWL